MSREKTQPVHLDVRDPRLIGVLDPAAHMEMILTGFKFTEGPIWHPRAHHLRFSDVLGNSTFEWSEGRGLRDIRPNSHLANGSTYDRQGRMLTCHHATSRITRMEPDGGVTVVASHYNGKQLNSPNDIIVRSDGKIFFTDPLFGREPSSGIPRPAELTHTGVYCLDPVTSELTLLADDFSGPNGLCFSLDEWQLFVNDTHRDHIRVFDVEPDGTLKISRVWATLAGDAEGGPDGMKIDSTGKLFATGPGGIHVFMPDATCLGVIETPEPAANLAFGDPDLCGLYITATTSVYRVRVRHAGLPLF
ncbi:MAG: gluconolactonase [Chloroflexi bacterium OLB13]|nr:MAG: gluconolactonase [Chloroflexi bacterium OLB13]